jgi:hypothetical protein
MSSHPSRSIRQEKKRRAEERDSRRPITINITPTSNPKLLHDTLCQSLKISFEIPRSASGRLDGRLGYHEGFVLPLGPEEVMLEVWVECGSDAVCGAGDGKTDVVVEYGEAYPVGLGGGGVEEGCFASHLLGYDG